MAKDRPFCIVTCGRRQSADLNGFCAKCWRERTTEGERFQVMSALHAPFWRPSALYPDLEELEDLRRHQDRVPPPAAPGQPQPIWRDGWTLWTYRYHPPSYRNASDWSFRPYPLQRVLAQMEAETAQSALADLIRRRIHGGVYAEDLSAVMLGR